MKQTKTTTLALATFTAMMEVGLPISMKEAHKRASRAIRVREGGYAKKTYLPGYGSNTPLEGLTVA